MNNAVATQLTQSHPGGWMPMDQAHVARWLQRLRAHVAATPRALVPPIAELKNLVASTPLLLAQAQAMFEEAWQREHETPLGQAQVRTFEEFLILLNGIMTTAPEAYQDVQSQSPAGLIGFPVNALLNWPLATGSGYLFFSNALINQQFKKILCYWSLFLQSPASRYVLTERASLLDPDTLVVPWLGELAKREMVQVADGALGEGVNRTPDSFEQIFECDPAAGLRGLRQLG
nr:phophatidylserine decarboxylase associated domain-containing protein [Aeromonas bivalvium]